jgi:protein involved in polysaccharide export with SLBB domain
MAASPTVTRAQTPNPAQIQDLLRQSGLAESLRERIRQSGLSAEQIRARLTASGYPADLLDAYMGMGAAPEPGAQVMSAAAALALPFTPQTAVPLDTGFVSTPARPPSRVFGVEVFQRTTTQFLPLLSGPVPSDYRLGPGDVLVLLLTGDVELGHTLSITREGFVFIPRVGQVYVANLTLEGLRELLYTRLSRVYSGVRRGAGATTRFDVSVANVRANQVYVVGEVLQPGAYQLSSLGTVLAALYAAGGLTETANTREILVQRQGRTTATFDLYDYLLRGDTRHDIRLETGDVVFVGIRGTRVAISGAVIRPAVYELKRGEDLAALVTSAGGFRPDADLQRVAVHRLLPAVQRAPGAPARAVIDVALALPAPHHGSNSGMPVAGAAAHGGVVIPSLGLLDGDSVEVDSVPSLNEQAHVSIVGMVEKPGRYPWRAGMTLRQLVDLARGPRLGADLREAEVARLPADRAQGSLAEALRVPLDSSYLALAGRDSAGRYFGAPGVAFPQPGSAPEVPLQPFDNVLILRQPDFSLQRLVTVTGEVRFPGTYALRSKDERLVEVLTRAGGLTAEAYPEGVRFYRRAGAEGRINVDLRRALRDADAPDNVRLRSADSIHVPAFLASVTVSGAVNSPGSVLYKRGAGLDYYVSAAGGYHHNADTKRVSVRFANGEVRTTSTWLFVSNKPTPQPGSEVTVPVADPQRRRTDPVVTISAIAQILASTITIIVVATR